MITNEEGQSESCLRRKKRRSPPLESTLLPPQSDDVLELDEAWTFVGAKQNPCWIWVALCRRTRQIQGKLLAIGLEEEPKMIANISVNSIRTWLKKMGKSVCPHATELVITADCDAILLVTQKRLQALHPMNTLSKYGKLIPVSLILIRSTIYGTIHLLLMWSFEI